MLTIFTESIIGIYQLKKNNSVTIASYMRTFIDCISVIKKYVSILAGGTNEIYNDLEDHTRGYLSGFYSYSNSKPRSILYLPNRQGIKYALIL